MQLRRRIVHGLISAAVLACGPGATAWSAPAGNVAPVCDAGGPYVAECAGATTQIILDGSASFDPDLGPEDMAFLWTTDCPDALIDDPTAPVTTMTLSSVMPCPLECTVTLTVDDGSDATMCDATVTVDDTSAPTLTCPPDVTVPCAQSSDPESTGSPDAVVTSVYFSDVDLPNIRLAPAEGGAPMNVLGAGLADPFFLDVDSTGGRFYWTDVGTVTIQRADLDGSNVQPLVTTGLGAPRGIALDVAGNRMYWADSGTAKIQRADLDGSNVQDLVTTGLSAPMGVALDLVNGKIYWVDPAADRIQRADLDGSNVEDVLASGVITPHGIAVDPVGGRIYWTDIGGPPAIRRADLDGGNVEDLVTTGLLTPQDITLDLTARRMYWADRDTGKVRSADFDGGNVVDVTSSNAPSGVALLRESTVSDECGDVTLAFSDADVSGVCPQEVVITRTWTATDACGNEASCVQVITVVDETPPVITGVPADATVECDSVPEPPDVIATDDCGSPTLEFTETTSGSCPVTLVRTWTATDACGNSTIESQTLTVEDTTPPMITCPPDIVLECPAEIDPVNTGEPVASDNCELLAVGFSDSFTPTCGITGVIVRTWTAVDACGNEASCEQRITVVDTMPPTITCPADVTLECGDDTDPASTGTPEAADPCGTVTLDFTDAFSPDCGAAGTIVRTWTATDACGNEASCEQRITVVDTVPPTIACPADVVLECPSPTDPGTTGTPIVADICGDATLVFVDDVTPGCGGTGTILRTWTVTDDCGNEDSCEQMITLVDTTPPVIDCPPQLGVQCDGDVPDPNFGDITATDACGDVIIEFVGDLPSGNCPTFITRTYRAIDECGNESECSQIIGVLDQIPPTITCPFSFPLQCEENVPAPATTLPEFFAQGGTASDNCGIIDFEHVSDIAPPDFCGPYNTILRTYRVTDVCFNTNQCVQFITVQDTTPPVITCPDDVTLECPADTSPGNTGTATATDNCVAGATVSFSDAITPDCGGTETIVRTWTATDACDNQSSCQQTITVIDTTPPTITCPPPLIFECEADVPIPDPDSIACTDTCSPDVTVEHVSDVPSSDVCPFIITRTYRCTDACGNTAECEQLITVDDMTPPVITCPADAVIECDCAPDPVDSESRLYTVDRDSDALRVVDPATGDTLSSVTIVLPGHSVFGGTGLAARPGTGEIWALLKISGQGGRELVTIDPDTGLATSVGNTDAAGERLSELAFNDDGSVLYGVTGDGSGANPESLYTLSQVDGTPAFVCDLGRGDAGEAIGFHPGDGLLYHMSGAGDQIFETIDDVGVDPCTTTDIPMSGDGFEESSSLTFWTTGGVFLFGDIEGDFYHLTASGAITHVATLDHVASGLAFVGSQPCATGMASATDNCADAPVITFVDDESPGVCPSVRIITRTWMATDGCGNQSTCIQLIDVVDSTPPVITCPPDVAMECSDSTDPADTGMATATDNCSTGAPMADLWINEFHYDNTGADIGEFIEVAGTAGLDLFGYSIALYDGSNGTQYGAIALSGVVDDEGCGIGALSFPENGIQNGSPDGMALVEPGGEVLEFICYEGSFTATNGPAAGMTCDDIGVDEPGRTPPGESLQLSGSGGTGADFTWSGPAADSPGDLNSAQTIVPCGGGGVLTITFSDDLAPGSTPWEFTIVRTWTATDACGNEDSCEQVITGTDTVAPALLGVPGDITVECDSTPPPDPVTSVDNCDPDPATTFTETVSGSCPATLTRTWTATDAAGNTDSLSQVITLGDTTPPVITCPPDMVLECPADTDPGSTGTATATDNCGGVTIAFTDATTPGCGVTGTIVRTWTATDECDNSSSCDQVIEVVDTTPPTITCPPDATLECPADTDPSSTGTAMGSDTCGAVAITFTDATTPGCGATGTIVRTWTATDACGNGASCDQVIEVVDTTPPTITCPPDATLECPADTDPSSTGTAMGSDTCGAVAITFTDATTPGCGATGTIVRTWTATDACGNGASCDQVIEVVDTTPPTITCPASVTLECPADTDPSSTGTAMGSDTCGGVTIAFEDDVTNGCGFTRTIVRTWTATDDCGNTATCAQMIDVVDTVPPTITCPPPLMFECIEDVPPPDPQAVVCDDSCSPPDQVTVEHVSDVPSGTQCPIVITRTYRCTDACGVVSECQQLITVSDMTPPTITCPPDVTVECDQSTDPPDTGTPGGTVYWADSNGGRIGAIGVGGGLSSDVIVNGALNRAVAVDAAAGKVYWTQNLGDSLRRANLDGAEEEVVAITLLPVGGLALDPGAGHVYWVEGTATTGRLRRADMIGGNEVDVLTGLDAPQGVALDLDNARLYWTEAGGRVHRANLDGTGASVLVSGLATTLQVTLDPDGGFMYVATHAGVVRAGLDGGDPTLIVPESPGIVRGVAVDPVAGRLYFATAAEGAGIKRADLDGQNVEVIVTDVVSPSQMTFVSGVSDNCDPDPEIGFTDQVVPGDCAQEQTIIRTWTVTDACGNTASCDQVIEVVDTTPPTLAGVPGDITMECGTVPPPPTVIAEDNCDPTPLVEFDETVSGECPTLVTRTWTATDACGNSDTATQVITLDDTTPPVITCPPDVTLECPADTSPGNTGTATATDDCGDVTIAFVDDVTPGCGLTRSIVRTWTATDACGNTSGCVQLIDVVDTTPPTLVGVPGDIAIECDTAPPPPPVTAEDNCDPTPLVQFDETVSGECPMIVTRTWTATDACGNTATATQVITLDDTTPPVITCPPDVTLECPADTSPGNTGTATATDDCGDVTIAFVDDVTPGCGLTRSIVRTWTATDACGNTSGCVQLIDVVDTTPPTLAGVPGDITMECGTVPPPPTVTAEDNCDPAPVVEFDETVSGECPTLVTRTWIATDACGNSDTATQVITLDDTTPPVIACPPDVALECPADTNPGNTGAATATDNCGDVTITFDDATTPGCGVTTSIARTWTATDTCGNTSSCVQVIDVIDTTPPMISCPRDVVLECPASTLPDNTGVPRASDGCGDVTIMFDDATTPGCGLTTSIVRTWTATDACGNMTTCQQLIEVVDTTPPVITCPPDFTLECPVGTGDGDTGTAEATDACGDVAVIFTDVMMSSCGVTTSVLRTWTATDACGNTASCQQLIEVVDTTPPVITCPPDMVLECPAETDPGSTGVATATDACGSATVAFVDAVEGSCASTGTIVRTWTATDECGNTSSCVQVIDVIDTTPPVILCPADLTLECPADTSPGNTGFATATDACGDAVVTFMDMTMPGCGATATIVRTWTATDACGNTSSCAQTVTVQDEVPPVVICPDDAIIECEVPYTFVTEAADNCGGEVTVDCSAIFIPSDSGTLVDNGDGSFTLEFDSPTSTTMPMAIVTCTGVDACSNVSEPCHFTVFGDCPGACIPICSAVVLDPPGGDGSALLEIHYELLEPTGPDCEVEAIIDIGCQTVPVQDGQIVDLLCEPVPIPCRVTGGGNNGHEPGTNRYTFGGQAGAPTANQPQPCGEWTHRQHNGPDGKFTFRAGTASAPASTEIDLVECSDHGTCSPSGNPPSPARQLDFEGVGSFKNMQDPSPPLAGVIPDETLHWFHVHVEDLGEPGNQGDPVGPNCPPMGSPGGIADCDCPDFYHIVIHATPDPGSPVIYEAYTYLNGGNFQIHPPTNGGGNCGDGAPVTWPGGPLEHSVDEVTPPDGDAPAGERGSVSCSADLVDDVLVINSDVAILIVTASDGSGNVEECVIDLCEEIADGDGVAVTSGGSDVPAVGVRFLPSDVELGGGTKLTVSADLDGDGDVDDADAIAVVSSFGATGGPADVDGDGTVTASDLLIVLDGFTPQPP